MVREPPDGTVVVGMPSRRYGVVRERHRGAEVVGRPYRRSGSGQGTVPEVRKWSGDPPEGTEVV